MQLVVMLLQLQLSELLQLLELLLLQLLLSVLLLVLPPPSTTPRMRTRTSPLATAISTVPDRNLEMPTLELSKDPTPMAETPSTMLLMPMVTVQQLFKQAQN